MSVIVDPKLGINVYAPFQSNQWEDSKKARRWLSFFASRVVMDTSCTALPASPAEGDTVLMSSSYPIHASEIARYSTELTAWEYMAPWAGLVVQDSSGADWIYNGSAWAVRRSGGGSEPSGGATPTALALSLSVVDMFVQKGPSEGSDATTPGVEFFATQALSLTGVRFYGFSGRKYKVSLWDGSTRVATTTQAANMTASGAVTVTLSTPVTLTPYKRYRLSLYDSSTHYPCYRPSDATLRGLWMLNPWVVVTATNYYGNGDVAPSNTASTEVYPVEPSFA